MKQQKASEEQQSLLTKEKKIKKSYDKTWLNYFKADSEKVQLKWKSK